MRGIKDLKESILNKTAGNLFVFNGDEWAVKKHYINKLAEDYDYIEYLDDTLELSNAVATKGFLGEKTLYVVPHDLDFLKSSAKDFESIKKRILESSDYGAIWVYTAEIPKSFSTHFDEYITDFDVVEPDIFDTIVRHEISLTPTHIQELCKNCNGNYGEALMEIDKIKSYADYEHISPDASYDDLMISGMLNIVPDKFSCKEFMNYFMLRNYRGLAHSLQCLQCTDYANSWYYLEEMVSDLKILYCFVKYGRYDGAKRAFEVEHLFWGRIRELRDEILPFRFEGRYNKQPLDLPWVAEDVQYLIYQLSDFDNKAKQGKLSDKEVIESLFYYFV